MHNTLQELCPWLEFCYVEAKFTLIIKGYLTNSEKKIYDRPSVRNLKHILMGYCKKDVTP